MQLTATYINYYHVCHRKLWLFANGVNMEHTSDVVYDGKLLHEISYPQRADKYTEIDLSATTDDGILLSGKIDFYDVKEKTIHEVKRSDKMEEAHEWQLKYYVWLLKLNDVSDVRAVLEYPKIRETKILKLSDADEIYLELIVKKILLLQEVEECPPKINAKICKNCSYYDLCYIDEI
ncbi:CRISPR-associated protein Cas4 [Chitinophaga sp.]|uniref:CRISPR-associated protein Cas4 n=1 Tax=Chitinophaga sp. TaxID=1869181 RepID=UPI002F9308F4